jgi:predicted DNA binding CopG/RHH family protein
MPNADSYEQDYNVRIANELRGAVKRRAEEEGMNIKGWVEWVIRRALKESPRPLKGLPK